MTIEVNIHEAKTHFSKLLQDVMEGREVVIARAGKPVARLVPFSGRSGKRRPGGAEGQVVVGPDFDAPLPDDIREAFGA